MDRRTFLAGLASTTAMVVVGGAAGGALYQAMPAGYERIEGYSNYLCGRPAWEVQAIQRKANTQMREALDVLVRHRAKPLPDGGYFAIRSESVEDDLRLYGLSYRRQPSGERVDLREVLR